MMGEKKLRSRLMRGGAATSALILFAQAVPAYAQEQTYNFDIRAQDLGPALRAFARAARQQVTFADTAVRGRRAPALRGSYTPRAAIDRLLAGSGLSAERGASGIFIVRPGGASPQGEAQAGSAAADNSGADAGATPEILVMGRRTLNVDIRRTRDDVQPYVTFDAEAIQRSGSLNVEDFLRTRLPMNASRQTGAQVGTGTVQSSINLRGLGANQTLILVDGRRLPSVNNVGSLQQPDINGIPLAAIERIEVLPSTASGIYGGGATGGAINIITRRDYAGIDVSATYGNSFRGDAYHYRLEGSAGFNLEGGRTHVLVSASHMGSEELLVGDRDFAARGRALLFANNPNAFFALNPPPLGFTGNIRSANGSNLVLRNGTALNSPRTFIPAGYSGPTSDGGAALVANAGRYNIALPAGINGDGADLLTSPTVDAASIDVRRRFTDRVEAYVDFSWNRNRGGATFVGSVPASVTLQPNAPNNPFTTPIVVSIPDTASFYPVNFESETLRALGGVIVRLPWNWTAAADYAWSRSSTYSAYTNIVVGDPDGSAGPGLSVTDALAAGLLDAVRDLNQFPLNYSPYFLPRPNQVSGPAVTRLDSASLRFSGPVIRLPGGDLTLATLLEWRKEKFLGTYQDRITTAAVPLSTFAPGLSQRVLSAYAEARVPLVSAQNAVPLIQELEIMASVRHDDYQTVAPSPAFVSNLPSRTAPLPTITHSANNVAATRYTVGLRYAPTRDFFFRVSHGTGFLPPAIDQIVPNPPNIPPCANCQATLTDPKRGGVPTQLTVANLTRGNPNLVPENSDSWSAGLVLTPRFAPDFRFSVDYTRIKKTNEIAGLGLQSFLDLEDALPGRVTRAPLTPADQALGYTGGAITQIDGTYVNLAQARVDAYDFQVDYTLRTPNWGNFHFYAVATWQPVLERRTLPTSSLISYVGFNGSGIATGPLEWRGNGGLTWDRGPLTLGWNAQYYDTYLVYSPTATTAAIATAVLNQGNGGRIPSQIYHDFFLNYRFSDSPTFAHGLLAGTEISLTIQNLFDHSPPIIATTAVSGGYSPYGDPRLRRISLTLRKHF